MWVWDKDVYIHWVLAREILFRTLSDIWNLVKCWHFQRALARYPVELVYQHLDDVCDVGAAGMDGLVEFDD